MQNIYTYKRGAKVHSVPKNEILVYRKRKHGKVIVKMETVRIGMCLSKKITAHKKSSEAEELLASYFSAATTAAASTTTSARNVSVAAAAAASAVDMVAVGGAITARFAVVVPAARPVYPASPTPPAAAPTM